MPTTPQPSLILVVAVLVAALPAKAAPSGLLELDTRFRSVRYADGSITSRSTLLANDCSSPSLATAALASWISREARC